MSTKKSKFKRFLIGIMALMGIDHAWALDTCEVDSTPPTYHERYVSKTKNKWLRLMPTQTVIQYAGNMGLLSAGIGWDYGKNEQWETHILFGFVPKYHDKNANPTVTIKENFIPWRLPFNKRLTLHPLYCGIYLNAIFGDKYWVSEPSRYPDGFYWQSTKYRLHIFLGQRLDIELPDYKHRRSKSMAAFYEVSTSDLVIRSLFQDGCHLKFSDIITLSVGLRLKLM